MARSKQQWRAEKKKLALRLAAATAAAAAPVQPTDMLRVKAEHPQLLPNAVPAPVTASASTVIDLTAEDEEDEDEEMGGMTGKEGFQGAGRPSIELEAPADVVDVADEESDEDEAWPAADGERGEAGTPPTQELGADDHDEDVDVRGERGKEDNVAPVVSNVLLLDEDEDEVEEDEALPIVAKGATRDADGGDPPVDSTQQSTAPGGEDLAGNKPTTDWAGRILRLVETAALEGESLEDGEIFEEGAVATSPTSVKRAIALERLALREDSGSDASVAPTLLAQQSQGKKKHKKRGKKKSKRKLEAMLMDGGPQETPPVGFERITRPHSFLSESYEAASPPVAGIPVPAPPAPPSFGALPPAFSGPPPPPGMPVDAPRVNHHAPANYRQYDSIPPPPFPPLPPYEDNQMLRVNRQGGVEMFSGNGRVIPPPPLPPNHVVPPPDLGAVSGSFKYRSIPPRMPPPPPPVTRHVQQLHNTGGSPGISPALSFGSPPTHRENRQMPAASTASANNVNAADDGMDLDMLRAMALRTKRASRSDPSIQTVVTSASTEVVASDKNQPSVAPAAAQGDAQPSKNALDAESLDEDLLLAMIRSSQKRKRSQKQVPPADEARTSAKTSTLAAAADSGVVSKQSTSAETEESTKDSECETVAEALPVPTVEVSTADGHSTANEPSPPPHKGLTAVGIQLAELPPTPVVRPLTACSQSLVIQLDEDDLMLADDDDDAVLNSPQSSAAPSQNVQDIRSAIDAMRRQIAEREKARSGSNKGAPTPSSSSASSSSSSSSNSLRSSPRSDGQLKPKAAVNPSIKVVTKLPSSTSSTVSSSSPSPAALQAEIRAMKERIAVKEREKRQQHEQQRQAPASSKEQATARAKGAAAPTLAMVMTAPPYS
jgi:hypothetical protein